jgi:hypothetical protein
MTRRRGQEGTALIPRNLQVAEDCRAVSGGAGPRRRQMDGAGGRRAGRGAEASCAARSAASRSGCSPLTLRGLERDGLVTRTVFPTIPPRVDYALTKLGHSLLAANLGERPYQRS